MLYSSMLTVRKDDREDNTDLVRTRDVLKIAMSFGIVS